MTAEVIRNLYTNQNDSTLNAKKTITIAVHTVGHIRILDYDADWKANFDFFLGWAYML